MLHICLRSRNFICHHDNCEHCHFFKSLIRYASFIQHNIPHWHWNFCAAPNPCYQFNSQFKIRLIFSDPIWIRFSDSIQLKFFIFIWLPLQEIDFLFPYRPECSTNNSTVKSWIVQGLWKLELVLARTLYFFLRIKKKEGRGITPPPLIHCHY